jgi:hypothetical protein
MIYAILSFKVTDTAYFAPQTAKKKSRNTTNPQIKHNVFTH